jgi:NADH-quinone oxidoreductase subunit M
MLTMYKNVVFGPLTNPENRSLTDLSWREIIVMTPIVVMIFWIGIYPKPFIDRIEPTVQVLLTRLEQAGATAYLAREDRAATRPLAGEAE